MPRTERILGIGFFNGSAGEAVEQMKAPGGCLVIPPSPALMKLNHDGNYRRALQQADLVLPDSGLLTLVWKVTTGRVIRKISGIDYLKRLLDDVSLQSGVGPFWVVSSAIAQEKALNFLRPRGFSLTNQDFFILSPQSAVGEDHALLLKLEERRPRHIVVALGSGVQEQLGIYLRDFLLYRPGIHCVGAALGFLTGDEAPIPNAFERRHLGWLARLRSQPNMILPRIGLALTLAAMVLRYRTELPPLRTRWSDQ